MTLRRQITFQAALAILFTTFLGIASSFFIINNEVLAFIKNEDNRLAKQVVPLITRYLELGLTWEEIDITLGTVNNRLSNMSSMGMMMDRRSQMKNSMGTGMNSQRSEMMSWAHINDHRIIITDSEGVVRIDSYSELIGNVVQDETISIGEKIYKDDVYWGSVFVGSMIDTVWNYNQKNLINKLIIGIALSSIFSLVLSSFFIWYSLRRTLKPIDDLTQAAIDGSAGNHEVHVRESGPSEILVLSKSFNEMNESIVRVNKARNDFFSNISHELNTPLSLIRGNLEAIVDGVYELSLVNIEDILKEAKQLSVIVDDMSFLSKMSSGVLFDLDDQINIVCLIKDIIKGFLIVADKSNVQIDIKTVKPEYIVKGNYSKLKQALSNILSNSILHGGKNGKVEISTNEFKLTGTKSYIEISILDHGDGVQEEELEKIFDRLYRTDISRSRAKGGHGLGLSISREIIGIHNGNISARNHKGGGLEILIELPIM